jgi:hypothetical protein
MTLCDECRYNLTGTGCKKNVVDAEEHFAGVSYCFEFLRKIDFTELPDNERTSLENHYNNSRGV